MSAIAELAEWDSFYVIVGSAAGALIGLQFVVMTLIAVRPPRRGAEANPVFGTPTIVHFGFALFLSALVQVPWHRVEIAATIWALMGLGGVGYVAVVTWRMHKQTVYEPVFEDRLFHVILPLMAYAVLALSSVAAVFHTYEGLFGIAAATLLLLLVGIHNAWDAVAYQVFTYAHAEAEQPKQETSGKNGPQP